MNHADKDMEDSSAVIDHSSEVIHSEEEASSDEEDKDQVSEESKDVSREVQSPSDSSSPIASDDHPNVGLDQSISNVPKLMSPEISIRTRMILAHFLGDLNKYSELHISLQKVA